MLKVFFTLDPSEWHGLNTESLWVEPVPGAADQTVFTVRNSPFCTKEVSYLDVIRAAPGKHIEGLDFVERIDGRGHSTYRLIVQQDWGEFADHWRQLESLGCTYESGSVDQGILYAVDVPEKTNIHKVYAVLEHGQKNDIWMFEEGHVGHPLKSGSN